MMRAKITLKLDMKLIREAKAIAAEEGTSVGNLLAERLERLVRERRNYDRARRRAIARLRSGFDLGWFPPRSRDELHD